MKIVKLLSDLSFRQAVWLLPVAMVIHITEELLGFPGWFTRHTVFEMTHIQFIVYNVVFLGTALVCCISVSWISSRIGIWALLFFCWLYCFWNGLFHISTTLVFKNLSPGTFTVFLLYIPLWFRLNHLARIENKSSAAGIGLAAVTSGVVHGALVYLIWWQEWLPLDWLPELIGIQ